MSALAATVRPRRRSFVGLGFVAPFLAVFAFVLVIPVGYSIYLSLFQDKLIGGRSFVGLANFAQLFSDPKFWDGVGRVALFLAVQVPIMLGLALVAALAIDSGRLRGASFFRISVFLPYAVPGVVAVLMWGFMYGDQFGLAANINDLIGSQVLQPLTPKWILLAIGNIVTWEFVGYNMLIFYSA
ncbi:MAG: sugar ABC transporter permease, partial [Cellulomonas sp.]|nr:sugar ABC transporter permease [Cellulomonas sp.]